MTDATSQGESIFLALPRVQAASGALKAVGLGRRDAPVIRWLMLKWLGLRADTTVTLTGPGAEEFAKNFFYFPVDDRYGYFNPFAGRWFTKHPSDWAVQTLYTQLTRGGLGQRETLLYDLPARVTTPDNKEAFNFRARPRAGYLKGLTDLMKSERLPARELAVWRFRVTAVGTTEFVDLVVNLMGELGVDQEEFDAVFLEDPDVRSALPSGGAA
jgi:hypothetical protein